MKIYDALGWMPEGKTAVKISTGEPPASNYLRPELIGDLHQSRSAQDRDGTKAFPFVSGIRYAFLINIRYSCEYRTVIPPGRREQAFSADAFSRMFFILTPFET